MDFTQDFLDRLNSFIILAKSKTYIGDGQPNPSCRTDSHDLTFTKDDFSYLDSYFGGADFIGEEVVHFQGRPVWAENYYGRLLKPEMISAAEVGQILKESLSLMYQEGRFLGGYAHNTPRGDYFDTSQGDLTAFSGREWVTIQEVKVYELLYHGGLIRE
jgi:hypothetical protein